MLPPEHFCVNVTKLIHINDCPSETVARRNILLAHFFSACFSFTYSSMFLAIFGPFHTISK